MRIAIVGAGSMGSWFARIFKKMGNEVNVYDKDPSKLETLKDYGVRSCLNLEETLENVDAALIAVPISAVSMMVERAASLMRGGILAEISSLKLPVIASMRRLPRRITPLSVHPLFGPTEPSIRDARFALTPVRDPVGEIKAAERLFPGAVFMEVDAEIHDKVMAYVLSLTHILALAASLTIPEELRMECVRLGGTSFRSLLNMMEAALTESPQIFTQLLSLNRWTKEALKGLEDGVREVEEALRDGRLGEVLRRGSEALREIKGS